MQPISRVFEKIPRMVRDLSNSMGKQVVAQIEGTTTEIDRALIEAIRDPVMHIIRNAINHGIESPRRAPRPARQQSAGSRCARRTRAGWSPSRSPTMAAGWIR